MLETEVFLYIVKLFFGGIIAFLAILLLSRTRDAVWVLMICGAVFGYAGLVFDVLVKVGIADGFSIQAFGLPLVPLFFTVLPSLFFAAALVLKIYRTGKKED